MLIEMNGVNTDANVSVDLASLSRTVESRDLFQGLERT
jgi:hemin uptake protein HemP